jgi:eukaryotic-like serine/threonine-protein kinase
MNRSYTISIPVRTFWRIVVPVVVGVCLIGAVAGIVVVDRAIMPNIVGVNKGIVAVPSVLGLEWEAARQKFFNVGLVGRIKSHEFSDSIPDGWVIRQYVAAGDQVKRGRHIDVAVSKGPEVGVLPSVKGLAEHVARLELQKKGFSVAASTRKYHDKVPSGSIIELSPPEGTRISREMEVEMSVSKGPKPTHAVMVNVVGEGLGEARAKIGDIGLKVGKVDYQNNPALAPGMVLKQSVPPGTNVPLESSVDLVVSVARN